MQNPAAEFDSNFWLTCITVDSGVCEATADDIRLRLEAENIESRLLWRPMHMQPVYADCPFYGDGTAERIFNKGLCLPSGFVAHGRTDPGGCRCDKKQRCR